jgi:hypothetical protein
MSDVDFFLNKGEKKALAALNDHYPKLVQYDDDPEAFNRLELFGLAEIHHELLESGVCITDKGLQVYRKQKFALVRTMLHSVVYPLIVAVLAAVITARITVISEMQARPQYGSQSMSQSTFQ